jgi:hypothetical protein
MLATRRKRQILAVMCLLFAAQLAACWQEVSIATSRVVPGPLPLPGVYSLAIGVMDGGDSFGMQEALLQSLVNSHAYSVYPADQARGLPPVDAIVSGTISVQHIDEDYAFAPHYDAYGRTQEVAYSRIATATLDVTLWVSDATSGRVLAQTRLRHISRAPEETVYVAEGKVRDAAYMADLFGPIDGYRLLGEAQYVVAERFAAQVAPRREPATVTLYTTQVVPMSVDAKNAAVAGDWLRAISLYAQGVDATELRDDLSNKDRAKAYYNLGVAYAYAGFYPAARQALRVAGALHQWPQLRAAQQDVDAFALDAQMRAAEVSRQTVYD